MVDPVAVHLNLTNESMELRDKIFQKVVSSIQELGSTNERMGCQI